MSVFTSEQKRVSKLIKLELLKSNDPKTLLKDLEKKIGDKHCEFYLYKGVNSKITIEPDGGNFKDDLYNVFVNHISFQNCKVIYFGRYASSGKPFNNVLCDNLNLVIKELDFNGEPFLKGAFKYRKVMLPKKRLSLPNFYRALTVILNGFAVCNKANMDQLISLGNLLFLHYAPAAYQNRECDEWKRSFHKIRLIANSVINSNREVCGLEATAKVVWNPDYEFTSAEKIKIFNEINGRNRKAESLSRLKNLFRPGMTQAELSKISGDSIYKIRQYWKHLNLAKLENIDESSPKGFKRKMKRTSKAKAA